MKEMAQPEEIKALRLKTGFKRRQYCEYFNIPYRTVQDWELGNRKMPQYLFDLMYYKLYNERMFVDERLNAPR